MFGFLKKKPVDRYEGKPFLKLVDSFVLSSIGELDPSQRSSLEQMTPDFQRTFKRQGTWEDIVMAELAFEPEVKSAIANLWVKNQEIARINGSTLAPMAFVEMFVAKNIRVA